MIHHIWCNYQNPILAGKDDGTPEGSCEMCLGLKKDHPELEGDDKGRNLMKKYFPNNRVVED